MFSKDLQVNIRNSFTVNSIGVLIIQNDSSTIQQLFKLDNTVFHEDSLFQGVYEKRAQVKDTQV